MPLPKAIGFLGLGWWVLHAIAILLVYQWGYVRGKGDERREARARALEKGER